MLRHVIRRKTDDGGPVGSVLRELPVCPDCQGDLKYYDLDWMIKKFRIARQQAAEQPLMVTVVHDVPKVDPKLRAKADARRLAVEARKQQQREARKSNSLPAEAVWDEDERTPPTL
jgi:hypothetical protein